MSVISFSTLCCATAFVLSFITPFLSFVFADGVLLLIALGNSGGRLTGLIITLLVTFDP